MTIAKMVTEYLDESAPPALTVAIIELIAAARQISLTHDICTICLLTAAADIVEQAADEGRIDHSETHSELDDTGVPQPTHKVSEERQ